MIDEVRSTLGTVTDRLQQILRTVRRDPDKSTVTKVDLKQLVTETMNTWQALARDKWKLIMSSRLPDEPCIVDGDHSHLQQAIENLIFNARDATFEMRNYLREQARTSTLHDQNSRKQRLIEAASWRGEVQLLLSHSGTSVILEISDNGIGMSESVREQCLSTHFTTKRDNALYEGHSAGMGLGLSFVAVILEHHHAKLEIESEHYQGSRFRIHFLPASSPSSTSE